MTATSERDPSIARLPRWASRSLQALAGIAVALVASECAFRVRDHGAFPHLNVYVPDEKLGARLRPGATEHVSFNGNPVTDVRINALGFRGDEWAPTSPSDDVLVVGDSQVFGLGVQEDETFSARLAHDLGGNGRVLNGGVPTYGPMEYAAVVEEQLAARPMKTVIYVINFANDLFEAARPNVDRHVVWDGWAVRKETAPDHVASFPGRTFLYRDSHAFYALRGYLHRNDEKPSEQAFGSEGSWEDLVAAAKEDGSSASSAAAKQSAEEEQWQADVTKARADAIAAQRALEDQAKQAFPKLFQSQLGAEYLRTHGNPGDIVVIEHHKSYGESSKAIDVTAKSLVEGAKVRAQIEASLKKLAARDRQKGKAVLASFEARLAKEKLLAELQAKQLAAYQKSSPLRPALERVRAACALHGARLVVVALPLDVQVSNEEWKKYDQPVIDMTSTTVLVRDLVDLSKLLGIEAFDATPSLVSAEPGAFLIGDIHLTPKGHAALSTALARFLKTSKPVGLAASKDAAMKLALSLPAGRTAPPTIAEWATAPPLKIGNAPLGCRAQSQDEWVRVVCHRPFNGTFDPISVRIAQGGLGEAAVFHFGDVTELLAPVRAADPLLVDFELLNRRQRLSITRTSKGVMRVRFAKADDVVQGPPPNPADTDDEATKSAQLLCACLLDATNDMSCSAIVGAPDGDCARTYAGNCPKLLACSAGDRSASPECLPGWTNAGATDHCFLRCDESTACEVGACTDWQGTKVCM